VGRITEVQQKRWKVDVQGRQEAVLLLSSIDLPGDVRRRRTVQDQLQMRNFYVESDMISAECHQFQSDSVISLHTRLKYGKLSYGLCVNVCPSLIRRMKTHFVDMESIGVSLIIGNNGTIWISPYTPKNLDDENENNQVKESQPPPTVSLETRHNMTRIRNSIVVLSRMWIAIHPSTVKYVFNLSVKKDMQPKDMLLPESLGILTENASTALSDLN